MQVVMSPKIIIIRLIRYCRMDVPFLRRQKVDRMKNTATQIIILFLMNMPREHIRRETKLVPSGYSCCCTNFTGSQYTIFFGFCLFISTIFISFIPSIKLFTHTWTTYHQETHPKGIRSVDHIEPWLTVLLFCAGSLEMVVKSMIMMFSV